VEPLAAPSDPRVVEAGNHEKFATKPDRDKRYFTER
jgi:hypothetical protein